MAIGAEEGDAIAWLDAGLTQRAGEASDALAKLRVGKSFVIADDRSSARKLLFCVAQTAERSEWNVHGAFWPIRMTRRIRLTDLHPLREFDR